MDLKKANTRESRLLGDIADGLVDVGVSLALSSLSLLLL